MTTGREVTEFLEGKKSRQSEYWMEKERVVLRKWEDPGPWLRAAPREARAPQFSSDFHPTRGIEREKIFKGPL